MQAVMKDGEHYGVIPGTKTKPTLLKPGAEKLCLLFRLDPEYELIERQYDGDHLTITARCVLFHAPSGQRRGSGLGSCSTREAKYAYRKGERQCPKCGKEAIIKGKEEYGGGWGCFKKKDGCNAKFKDGDAAIEGQKADRVANPDLADTYNTVLKMATKRALVAAVLNVTAASDIFTQDLEDLPSHDARSEGDDAPRQQQRTNVAPHIDADENWNDPSPPQSPFPDINQRLLDIERQIDTAATYQDALAIRAELGSKAKPNAPIPLAIQRAKEARAISPEEYKKLSANWQRCHRKTEKLEAKAPAPDAADSFSDPDDDDPSYIPPRERQPGDD
jgi:nitrite reductase/ring-hydroxylating ferredoxin subunit